MAERIETLIILGAGGDLTSRLLLPGIASFLGSARSADLTVIGPQGATVDVRPYALHLRYDVPGAPGQVGTAVAVFDAEGKPVLW